MWIAIARDPTNNDDFNKTGEWLKSKVMDKTICVPEIPDEHENPRLWSQLTLADAGVEEVKRQLGVKAVAED